MLLLSVVVELVVLLLLLPADILEMEAEVAAVEVVVDDAVAGVVMFGEMEILLLEGAAELAEVAAGDVIVAEELGTVEVVRCG